MTREEIIKGLGKIGDFFQARADMAVDDGKMLLLNWMKCAEEAAEAVKVQEARLLTYEDFHSGREDDGEAIPCWKEARSMTRRSGWAVITYGKMLADRETGVARYWTAKPTDEQMREEAWTT
jgi:hypothetical protein